MYLTGEKERHQEEIARECAAAGEQPDSEESPDDLVLEPNTSAQPQPSVSDISGPHWQLKGRVQSGANNSYTYGRTAHMPKFDSSLRAFLENEFADEAPPRYEHVQVSM